MRFRLSLPRAGIFASLLLLVVIFWQLAKSGDPRIDDAYITFSFSKNLSLGNGPVYSHGLRVEGYSNFLWMAIVAIGYALFPGADPYALARASTIPFALLLAWATFRLARRGSSPLFAWSALLLLSLHAGLYWAALSGLETLPYTALLTAGLALYLDEPPDKRWPLAFPCLVLAALMRIDGMVPLAFVAAWDLASRLSERRFSLSSWARFLGPGLFVYVAWFAWRYAYYGLPLPTTYYAKVDTVRDSARGIEYAWHAFRMTGLVAALPLFGMGIVRRPFREGGFLAAFALVEIAYVIHVGGDWMPFSRFFLPLAPIVAALFAWGLTELLAFGRRTGTLATLATSLVAIASLGFVAVHIERHSIDTDEERNDHLLARSQEAHVKETLLPAAKLLRHAVPEGSKLVSDYAGVMALVTKAAIIDMWGLCNEMIATKGTTDGVNAIYGRTCPSCYAHIAPDYFHVMVPIVRERDAFASQRAVVRAVWQHETIGRYLDFDHDFVAGRIGPVQGTKAAWFLERRKPGARYEARHVGPGLVVDYPFEG